MKRNYNPKLLSDEELINEYYHVRADVEAYGVSSDIALLPELKKELVKRIKYQPEELYAQAIEVSRELNQTIGEKKNYYVTLKQLQEIIENL